MLPETEYLDSRQQMKIQIQEIINDNFGFHQNNDVIKKLCLAVDFYFPSPN